MPSQLHSRSSSGKSIMAWWCLSASVSTGVRAAFLRNAPAAASTRSAAFLHSLGSTERVLRPAQVPARLAVSTTPDVESKEAGYDVVNKERGLDTYDPSLFESDIYSWWEKSGCFEPDAKQAPGQKESYVLPMPPPNVTGRLHMGHAIFVALQDVLARFHRMRGRPVLWLPGTDHAGIATQLQVEKQLLAEGES